jgi:predicted XRE-type DNA-binding protein
MMSKPKIEEYKNVWDALADTPEEAANLTLRSDLMMQIEDIVKENGWTQAEAAKRCGITQPRMNDLLRGKISRFSVDALVNIAAKLGRRITLRLDAA